MRVPSMRLALVGLSVACASCASEYHPEYHPESSYTVNQSVSYPTIYQVGAAATPTVAEPRVSSVPEVKQPHGDPSRVVVVESAHLDRPGEVVAVLDVENASGSRDSGIALLRERAAELGADAVVSVEFHPTRVSGLAVRFERDIHTTQSDTSRRRAP